MHLSSRINPQYSDPCLSSRDKLAVLEIGDILLRIRIRTSDEWIRIRLLSSVTLKMQKNFFFFIFSYNLPAGTLSSVLEIKFFAKILLKFHFASIISVRSTDPDPCLRLMDPDGPKSCGFCRSGSGSHKVLAYNPSKRIPNTVS